MAQTKFLQHTVELGFIQDSVGKKLKQAIPNLKESVSSDQLLSLGDLFTEMAPDDVTLEEIVTVKRTEHHKDM